MLISLSGCLSKGTNSTEGIGARVTETPASPDSSVPKADIVALYSPQGFTAVEIGTTAALTYILANVGTENAVIDSISVTGVQISATGDTCSTQVLSPGQTCNLTLSFSPLVPSLGTANYRVTFHGVKTAAKTITQYFTFDSNPANPDIVITPNTWDFGQISTGGNGTKTFLVSNQSSGSATFGVPNLTGTGFTITANTCTGQTLTIASSPCSVTLRFAPTYPGAILGQFTFNYTNASGNPMTKALSLTGYGDLPQPTLSISPTPLNFGNVATNASALQYFTVSNNTSAAASVGIITVAGAGFFINSNTCNSVILGGAANCQISIRFTPTVIGASAGSFNVPYSSAQGTQYNTNLVLGGTGISPTVAFIFSGFTSTVSTDTSNLTATGVRLNWSAQSQATYYVITQNGGSGGTITTPNIFPTTKNFYDVTNLVPGNTYQFKINAFDTNGTSDGNSNWVTVTTPNIAGSTFSGWSDVVATGSVFTDISLRDAEAGRTGASRLDRNLAAVAGFDASMVDSTTGIITTSLHPFTTGQRVTFRSYGTAPTGLLNSSNYYAIRISSTLLKLAASAADAQTGTPIIPSDSGTGSMTLMPTAVVKLGWELFSFTPAASATSYKVYRSLAAGSGFSLTGSTTTKSYFDYEVAGLTTYYYKIVPEVSGVEVTPSVAADSVIKIYVPSQNMSLVHRWIANREMCHSLMALSWPNNVDRTDNYSCAYTWGLGFAPNLPLANKQKWDIGHSLVMDRWQTGCKFNLKGNAYPDGSIGVAGDVYYRQNARECFFRDPTLGWIAETSTGPTPAQRSLMRTNYPGYAAAMIKQSHAYQVCQLRTESGLVDGNGNANLRLFRVQEGVAAKAFRGQNVESRSVLETNLIFNSADIPTNGSCNLFKNNDVRTGIYFEGILSQATEPSYYTQSSQVLMNGTALTRNCHSRYEISGLNDAVSEWTSNQYYTSGYGNGYFMRSTLDPANVHMENIMTDGTMGFANSIGGGSSGFYNWYSDTPVLPMFGFYTVSASTSLGSRAMNGDHAGIFGGSPALQNPFFTGFNANNFHGVMSGQAQFGFGGVSRYNFTLNPADSPWIQAWNDGTVNFRCTGQVDQ